jgi:hypothetical protein
VLFENVQRQLPFREEIVDLIRRRRRRRRKRRRRRRRHHYL